MARLYVTAPGGRTGIYELTKPVISIGRGSANDLVLNSEKVSRFHAVVRRVGEQFVLADRGSTNGVEVNKNRVPGDATLVSDDVIQIGDYILRFENTVAKDLQIERDSRSESGAIPQWTREVGRLRHPVTEPPWMACVGILVSTFTNAQPVLA